MAAVSIRTHETLSYEILRFHGIRFIGLAYRSTLSWWSCRGKTLCRSPGWNVRERFTRCPRVSPLEQPNHQVSIGRLAIRNQGRPAIAVAGRPSKPDRQGPNRGPGWSGGLADIIRSCNSLNGFARRRPGCLTSAAPQRPSALAGGEDLHAVSLTMVE